MAISNKQVTFSSDIHTVWETVTNVARYTWRSDLSRTEILSETQFVEYTTNGYATTFTVTALVPYRRWEFDMENDNMKGHWIGVFTPDGANTQVSFTEEVSAKKLLMKPFVKRYLKRQQDRFVADLEKALKRKSGI